MLVIPLSARAQTEVTLLAPNPFRGPLDKVVAGFESKTGYKLKVTYGKGMGTRQQVARGEIFDVSILLPPYPEALASGNIDPKSATKLATLPTLGARREKVRPKPDISTPEAFKALLTCQHDRLRGTSMIGKRWLRRPAALQKLGVVDQIKSKTKLSANSTIVGDVTAKGGADVCIFYLNEMEVPGLDVVGRLPKQVATPGEVVAFISTHVKDAKAAKALVLITFRHPQSPRPPTRKTGWSRLIENRRVLRRRPTY